MPPSKLIFPACHRCPHCQMEYPFETRLTRDKFGKQVLMIDTDEIRAIIRMHWERHHPEHVEELVGRWQA